MKHKCRIKSKCFPFATYCSDVYSAYRIHLLSLLCNLGNMTITIKSHLKRNGVKMYICFGFSQTTIHRAHPRNSISI